MHNSKFRFTRADIMTCALVFVAMVMQGSYIIGPTASIIFPSTSTPGLIQSNEAHVTTSPTNISVSFSSLPQVKNIAVVEVNSATGTAAVDQNLAVTDNQGNSYSRVIMNPSNAGNVPRATFWCSVIIASSGTFTVTATWSSNTEPGISVYEYANTTCNVDHATGAVGGTSPYSCGSFTTINGHDLLMTALTTPAAVGAITYTAPAGFTIQRQVTNTATGWTMAVADQIVSATNTFTPTFSATQNLASTPCDFIALISK